MMRDKRSAAWDQSGWILNSGIRGVLFARISESVKSNVRPIAPVLPQQMVDSRHARPLRGVPHDGDTRLSPAPRRVRRLSLQAFGISAKFRLGANVVAKEGLEPPTQGL